MADIERLSRALKAAHAAGDTAAATKLAQAIKAANQSTQPNQNDYNPAGTGFDRAIARGAITTAASVPSMLATADARALADAQKSEEAIRFNEARRAGIPNQAFASRAADISNPKQVNSMMKQYGVSPQANVNYQQVTEKRLDTREDAIANPLPYIERLTKNARSAGKLFELADGFERSPAAAAYAQTLAEAPDSFKGWLSTVTDDPLGFMAFMGETIAENAPQIAAGITTSVVTGNPTAGAAVMSLGGFSREYASEIDAFLKENDIDLRDPEAARKMFNNPAIMDEANKRGMTRGLVIAAADLAGQGLVAQNVIKNSLTRQTIAQSSSEGLGEALATKAVGDEFSAKDTITETIAGGAMTTAEGLVAKPSIRSLFTKDGKLVDPNSLDADQKQTAASVAQLLRQIADQNGYNLKNVNASSDKGAKKALEGTRRYILDRLAALKGDKELKKLLTPKQRKSLDQLLDDFAPASGAFKAAGNKVSDRVTQEQFDAIMRLLPDSAEKTEIANLLKMSNQVTDLFNNGLKGGLSQYTDYFNPLSVSGAAYDPRSGANVVLGGGAAIATFGKTLAIPAAGRIVDFFTGRRSNVARFVKKNENRLGLATPDGPSLIEQAEQKKATSKARRQAVAKIATILNAPKPGFVENILLGTGLDRNGLETVLNNMAADFASDPEFTSILNDIQSNLDAEGVEYLDVLTEIIPVIGAYAQANSPDLITNTPDNPLLKRDFEGPNVDPTSQHSLKTKAT